jgi:hypothetical protein
MAKKAKQPTFDEILTALRSKGFDVISMQPVAGATSQVQVEKYGCAAILVPAKETTVALLAKPGLKWKGEIAHILDRGFQKFLKTSKLEIPATAERLEAIHRFSEELKEVAGTVSLYNESLGTVSDQYLYDRVVGRDLPLSARAPRPWELSEGSK